MAPEYVEKRDALIAERDRALRELEAKIRTMRDELEAEFNTRFNILWTEMGYRS